jgi:signal transduction histidine kinase
MSSESIKVLLVEDNLGDARLLYEGMEEALPGQFQMTHVRRLSETLEFLWEDTCSVVLLDLGLPDSHGLNTLVLVRAQAPDVPIVVLTGFQDEEMGDQALKDGAQDYLIKGQVDSKLLARSMRYAIARKAAEQAMVQQGVALAKADDLQRSRQRLIRVHEQVRRAVAAQLQDGVQEKLQAAAGRLREFLEATAPTPETTRVLDEVIAGLCRLSDQEVGLLGRELYPTTLNQGLVPTFRSLQSFGDHLAAAPAIEIALDDELVRQEKANPDLFPEQVGLAMYRIAEEALANVTKHAKASKVTVRLDPLQREGWWRLTVQDDGQGFDVTSVTHGLGIATMYDYARAGDGECVIQSTLGVGTEVTAALPLSGPDARPDTEPPEPAEKGDN